MKDLTSEVMLKALTSLDKELPRATLLTVGGGGAMLLAYRFPLATSDIDAVPRGISSDELKPFIEELCDALDLVKPGMYLYSLVQPMIPIQWRIQPS